MFVVLALPWPILAYLNWTDKMSLSAIAGFLGPLIVCATWYFTLRDEERFESQPQYQEHRTQILSMLRIDGVPELSSAELPTRLSWSDAREHFGVTKHGPGKFLRTTFWSQLAFGHFDQVGGRITAVSISPNFGRWRRCAEVARQRVLESQKPNQPPQTMPLTRHV